MLNLNLKCTLFLQTIIKYGQTTCTIETALYTQREWKVEPRENIQHPPHSPPSGLLLLLMPSLFFPPSQTIINAYNPIDTTWPLTQHYTVYPYDNIMCSNRILWSSTLHTAMMMAMHFIRLFFLFLLPHNQTQSLANDESQWDYHHHHHQQPSFRGISTVVNH